MRDLIRHILKEEHQWDLKKNHLRYERLINKLVYEIFDEGICGFDWETFKLDTREGISIRIVLHFTEDSFRDFDYERYGQSKQELKNLIEDYLPKFDGIYIVYDTTKCEDQTKSLNENKKRNYLRQLNDIVEPYKEDECICDINISYDEDDDMYSVYFVTSTECMAEKFDNSATFIVRKISKIKHDIKQEIKSFLPIENIYVGSYGKPNCDWDPVRRIDENKDEQFSEDRNKLKLIKNLINDSDIFDYKHFCGVDIIPPEERTDQYNFLNKNKIPFLIKVYFVGGPNSEVWPRTQAIRNKELDLIENLHDHIKSFVPYNIEIIGSHVNSCEGYEKLMKRKYTTDELQESTKKNNENKDKDLSKKLKLAKGLIYDFFGDEVSFIEQSTYDNKPLLKIYYTTDSEAANHSTWLAERISELVMEYTGNNLILAPWYTFGWDVRKKLADIYIGCEELKTDEDGNVLNEIELTEKCWKGYTQKGMKTMFGKRYPNCIKNKK